MPTVPAVPTVPTVPEPTQEAFHQWDIMREVPEACGRSVWYYSIDYEGGFRRRLAPVDDALQKNFPYFYDADGAPLVQRPMTLYPVWLDRDPFPIDWGYAFAYLRSLPTDPRA